MHLGLERGKTELLPHNKHVGSTAIKSISAKPIVDIAVALDDVQPSSSGVSTF